MWDARLEAKKSNLGSYSSVLRDETTAADRLVVLGKKERVNGVKKYIQLLV